jgi:hypothetical protein
MYAARSAIAAGGVAERKPAIWRNGKLVTITRRLDHVERRRNGKSRALAAICAMTMMWIANCSRGSDGAADRGR